MIYTANDTFRNVASRLSEYGLTIFLVAVASLACADTTRAAPVIINGDFSAFVPSNGTVGGWTSANY